MRAILPLPAGGFGLRDVAVPTIGAGEMLLEARACGLCGTDLAKLSQAGSAAGSRLGHEVAGIVRDVGQGVARFRPGDRVVAAHHVPCGDCWACRHGSESMCPQFKATNIEPGGFAEMVRLSRLHVEEVVLPIPPEMPFEIAAFAEPLACAVRAVDRTQLLPGDDVGIYGAGAMGLLIAQAAAARGARPTVVEVSESRMALARALGLRVLDGRRPETVEAELRAATGGAGLSSAVLTALTPATLGQAERLIRPGGRLGVFAGPMETSTLPLDFDRLYHAEISVISTYSATPRTLAQALALLEKGQVAVEPLISHRLPLAAFDEGVRLQRTGQAIKVIFQP